MTREEVINSIKSDLEFKNFRYTSEEEKVASQGNLQELEDRLGYKLPFYCRCFLETANGGISDFNTFVLNRGLGYLNYFLGLYEKDNQEKDIRTVLEVYGKWIPADCVPVAVADYSEGLHTKNLLCVGLTGTVRERVYYWSDDERREIQMKQTQTGGGAVGVAEINKLRKDTKPRFGNVTYLDSDLLAFLHNLFVYPTPSRGGISA